MFNTLKTSVNIIFFLGGPGVGKGALCQNLAKEFNLHHMSVGNLLRQVNVHDEDYNLIKNHMKQGLVVPSRISCRLIEKAMMNLDEYKTILMDGFPRNFDNYMTWNKMLSKKTHLVQIFHLICPEDIMLQRCLHRNTSTNHTDRRIDDKLEVINLRIVQYKQEILPLINYLQDKYPMTRIKADQSIDLVCKEAFKNMEKILNVN